MSNQPPTELCREVQDSIASVLDGDAEPRLLEHLAECDYCRDLRYEAEKLARFLQGAGADYKHPEDFEQTLMHKLEGRISAALPIGTRIQEPLLAEPAAPSVTAPMDQPPELPPPVAEVAPAVASPAPTLIEAPAAPATEQPAAAPVAPPWAPPDKGQAATVTSIFTRRPALRTAGLLGLGVGALAAAAALAIYARSLHPSSTPSLLSSKGWSGHVLSVKHAGAQGEKGLEQCSAQGSDCSPLGEGAELREGAMLRTDARTRAQLELSDGTKMAVERSTELVFAGGKERIAKLNQGALLADVAHLDSGPGASFEFPLGRVEVLGTKLALTVAQDRASVEVLRGAVRLSNRQGASAVVHAGQEGALRQQSEPVVSPSTTLGESMLWSERTDERSPGEETQVRGLGELRARKPGQTAEKTQAVRLAKHEVHVRIAGSMARTEIDETFFNDTGEVLEGIYRFPLPPDAQIERLALEVDGKLQEGAFVDKERAAAIWRGVIHAAAPTAPKPREEIVWVPGPWRDPALLEWQRGGHFELRIYPIPAHGSRRLILAYTQTIAPSAGARRYTYPLSYDPSGSSRIEDFRMDVQVRGQDPAFGVRSQGYELAGQEGESDGSKRLSMSAQGFVPSGDLSVEYALPEDKHELTAWAYRPEAPLTTVSVDAGAKAAPAMDTSSPYVAIALRPQLPKWSEGKSRDQIIVVDSSRSMVGERFKRASRLAETLVQEMDRQDRFGVMVCDTHCQWMSEQLEVPGGAAATRVHQFLSAVEPDGGTDLVEAVQQARSLADKQSSKQELRIIYVGDGTPSIGAVRPSHIAPEVSRLLPSGTGMLTTVAVGADADNQALAAMARGGGGVAIPYVPGERAEAVALRVLSSSYGVALQNPVLELPSGLSDVYPKVLDNMAAGSETMVVARMTSGSELTGTIKLKGQVGGQPYEQTYPVTLAASSSAGNAFVPRLYAATKIGALEASDGQAAKGELVELSKSFSVASRYTSLLVLESEAMFKAFGVEHGHGSVPSWSGEAQAEGASAQGVVSYRSLDDAEEDSAGAEKKDAKGKSSGYGMGEVGTKSEAEAMPGAAATVTGGGLGGGGGRAAPASPPSKSAPKPQMACSPNDPLCSGYADFPRERRAPSNWIPMRRIWERSAEVSSDTSAAKSRAQSAIAMAESEVAASPDSRTKLEKLFGLYEITGQLERASELAERWASRDALDPGALTARAEVLARQGDRARAIRVLSGLADVRSADPATQTWLAGLYEAQGEMAKACAHRITLAELRPSDIGAQARAVRCAQSQGKQALADMLTRELSDAAQQAMGRELTKTEALSQTLRGDIRLEASWESDADLDVTLIGKNGQRLSWLGEPTGRVSVQGATSSRSETLAFFNAPAGDYLIEMSRGRGASEQPVRGSLIVKAVGTTRTIPFVLTGQRLELGTIKVQYVPKLVPVSDW